MVAFAVGGLLGDTLFHLLPEIFLGEDTQEHVKFVMVEPNKNLLLGVAMMVGLLTFVALDKTLRIATGGGGGHDHSHGHSHGNSKLEDDRNPASAITTGTEKQADSASVKQRRGDDAAAKLTNTVQPQKEENPSAKLGKHSHLHRLKLPHPKHH